MNIEERRAVEIARYAEPRYAKRRQMREWRQDIVKDWLESQGTLHSHLDVGCGCGEVLAIARDLKCYDSMGYEVVDDLCDGEYVFHIEGVHDLPANTNAFQVTTCNDVLEHVIEEDVPAALSEISRVTKGPILLGISRKPDKHGYHITIKSEEWWMAQIAVNMEGIATVVYADRIKPIKQPYLFVEIRC